MKFVCTYVCKWEGGEGRGIGEGQGQGQGGLKKKTTTHKYNCNGYQKSHHGVSILGEKVFCCWT